MSTKNVGLGLIFFKLLSDEKGFDDAPILGLLGGLSPQSFFASEMFESSTFQLLMVLQITGENLV